MIQIALPEHEREHGPSSDTPNEQLEDTMLSEAQNVGESDDQGIVVEGPLVVAPGHGSDDDQLGDGELHTVRSRRSGGEYRRAGNIPSINIYQFQRVSWMARGLGLPQLSQWSMRMDLVLSKPS